MLEERETMGSDKAGVMSIVAACNHFGVNDVVICPGSRNAPLTISFNQSGLFNCHSLADERAAAFFALGLATASDLPVAIVCTSGSAVVNFGPAMAEAFYQKVPLIAISADRPLEWTDQGNGQTIRQEGVLDNFVLDSFSIKSEPNTEDEQWFNRRRLSEGFNLATEINRGPLHINVPISEPLYNTVSAHNSVDENFFSTIAPRLSAPEFEIQQLSQNFTGQPRVMILVGQMNYVHDLNPLLNEWADLPQVVILSETLSNIECDKAIATIDRLVMSIQDEEVLKELMPDVLISMGGFVVSKKIKALLRKFKPGTHIHLSEYDESVDTYQSLTHHIKSTAEFFMADMLDYLAPVSSTYATKWQALDQAAFDAHDNYVKDIPFSDFYAFKEIFKSEIKYNKLHLSNSSPVRYSQLFGNQSEVEQYTNRGTSGIDGCTSTAAGFAHYWDDDTHLLITGDVAFKYDINALWNSNFPENLKIIVINNGGGGIFRIIEGPTSTDEHAEFFEANHPVDIQKLVTAYGFAYFGSSDKESLATSLIAFGKAKGKSILEITTPKELNDGVLKGYFKEIRETISER